MSSEAPVEYMLLPSNGFIHYQVRKIIKIVQIAVFENENGPFSAELGKIGYESGGGSLHSSPLK